MRHRHLIVAALVSAIAVSSAGCGESDTGVPGPIGPAFDGASLYRTLRPGGSLPTGAYASDFAKVRSTVPFSAAKRVAGAKEVVITGDDGVAARIELRWETVAVGRKHAFASIAAHGLEYAKGCKCTSTGVEVAGMGLTVNIYPQWKLQVQCTVAGGEPKQAWATFGDGKGSKDVKLGGFSAP